ncbi:hypothetical protein GCM10011519_16810 [Marmoricola endophyticus]|uniref:pectate lyase n=1 Tax=Marmoricola endophyticus TaxID=2040280 RepID=A0A917BJJ9_9ACTN|nr:polysaccharide lyase family 1 protein [Marmoricola endophyticus]GGF43603.1 hypothetical protein GCM10011519_16810 [Marmoricola endophyticus]
MLTVLTGLRALVPVTAILAVSVPALAVAGSPAPVAVPDPGTAVAPAPTSVVAAPGAPSTAASVEGLRAHGFASGTTGGGGGAVVVVTSDRDDPASPVPGSLRWALSRTGPTWVVFARDMTVRLAAPLRVPSNTTIDGRGHDVHLTGPRLTGLEIVDATNVIVENLTLTDFGDVTRTASNDEGDAVHVERSSRVWIDHCTLERAGDKLVAVQASSAVTVSWNHFADQQQTMQVGSLSTAAEDVRATVTVDHNWFDRVGYRTPVVSYGKAHVYNNYLDRWQSSAVRSERVAQVVMQNNVLRAGASQKGSLIVPGQSCNDAGTRCDARGGYLLATGNLAIGKVVLKSTGSGHVFDPRAAYAARPEAPTVGLADTLVRGAGASAAIPLTANRWVRLAGGYRAGKIALR